jgi:heptosyltransferase-1
MTKKILIIRLSSIGDILHTMTVLSDIKKVLPDSEIDWLVDSSFEGVAKLSPLIDNVIAIPLRRWKKNKFSWFYKVIQFRKLTIGKKYDYIIDTQGLIKSAILAKILFNGKVYGLDALSAREKISSYLYDYKYYVDQNAVAVTRLRGLIAKIFNLQSNLNDFKFIINTTKAKIDLNKDYIMILHGTSKENKKWSLENWVQLINWFIEHTNKDIVATYSNSDELKFVTKLNKKITNSRFLVVEKLNFSELSGLIKDSCLVIGVDTGFTHMANLLKIPTIAIYLHSKPSYVGIVESKIGFNLGGYKQELKPNEIIDCILQNKLI